jgi:signal peptidase
MRVPCRELIPSLADEVLNRGGRVRLTVHGLSMSPFLRGGDVVELAPLPPAGPRVGDIVLARDAGGFYLLHRVARIGDGGYYLLGDAQTELSGPYERGQLTARVVAAWRGTRRLHVVGPGWRLVGPLWSASPRGRAALRELWRHCRRGWRRWRGRDPEATTSLAAPDQPDGGVPS